MDLDIIWSSLPKLLDGALLTLELTLISLVIGFMIAIPVALLRLSRQPLLSAPAYGYIVYFRGTPLLVQLFLIYYGSGQFSTFLESIGLWGLFREAYFCALLTLTLNTGAYTAEIFRGAIQAVPRGELKPPAHSACREVSNSGGSYFPALFGLRCRLTQTKWCFCCNRRRWYRSLRCST